MFPRRLLPWLSLALALALSGFLPASPWGTVVPAVHAAAVPAGVPMPNPTLTPGEAFKGVTVRQICTPGYARSARAVSLATKGAVFKRYGIAHPASGAYEIDQLISLELGGDNSVRNLWPEPIGGSYGAHQKDGLENYLHAQVCANRMSLIQAQHAIASNWYVAWIAAGRPGAHGLLPPAPRTSAGAQIVPVPAQPSVLRVQVTISPDPVDYGSYPSLSVQTAPHALCQISVVYDTGRAPTSYPAHNAQADSAGQIVEQGHWHMEIRGTSGVATAICSVGRRSAVDQAEFTIW